MTIMLEAVKRQLKSTYDYAILSYVMSILGFLAAMVMWLVLRGVLRKEAQYVPLGTIMALGLCGLCILFSQIFQTKLLFALEISMGSTRRIFFLSYLLVQALYNAGNYILLVLLILLEKKTRPFLVAHNVAAGKKAELIWSWTIRYGFPALLVFTIVSILFGTLWMYFGKVVGVILWTLWMAFCLGGPNIADAITDAPNSILGKVGLGIAGMISFFSGATGMIVGIVIVIAVLVIIYCMMQRQAVQF